MLEKTLDEFKQQLSWEPTIVNAARWTRPAASVVVGMGGSHIPAGFLLRALPHLNVSIHRDYGLPAIPEFAQTRPMVIAQSYSGNTEETLDGLREALRRSFPAAAIATGGDLIKEASAAHIPHVIMPKTAIQPRFATGFGVRALLALLGEEEALQDTAALASSLDTGACRKVGESLAEKLFGKIPIVYTSTQNRTIGYLWKAIINEGAKIPAFTNAFPELNHNEMNGFAAEGGTRKLSEAAHFVFLRDTADDERVAKRMDIAKQLFEARGFSVEDVVLTRESVWRMLFEAMLTAGWLGLALATRYGVEPEQVPMVEEFKKLMRSP